MKSISGKDLCRILEKKGWQLKNIHGSHHVYMTAGRKERISVPVHGNKDLKTQFQGKEISLFVDGKAYQSSVHGQNACTTCHQGVETIPHQNPVYGKELIKQTGEWCNRCHTPAVQQYSTSVHGQPSAIDEGVTCSSCHGDTHRIEPVKDLASPVAKMNLEATCTGCHDGKVAESYGRSFHGTALNHGYTKAASCVDCHGSHGIFSAQDPQSKVSKQNLPNTCVSCHGGKPVANWADGKEHVTPEDKENAFPLWIVWKVFLVLILFDALQGGSVILLELFHQLRHRLKAKHHAPARQDAKM